MKRAVAVGTVAAALLAAVAAVVLFQLAGEPDSAPAPAERPEQQAPDDERPAAEAPAPVEPSVGPEEEPPAKPAEPALALPHLDDSDAFVREQFGRQAPWPVWLQQKDLLLRAAAFLDSASKGEVPRRLLSFVQLPGRFAVAEVGGAQVIDPASYARYEGFVAAATSIEPARTAQLARLFEPLLAQAMAGAGTDAAPLSLLQQTLDEVLSTPVINAPLAVERPKVLYRFADPALERRSPLQKQLLRMGPDNVRRLKAYARSLRRELDRDAPAR